MAKKNILTQGKKAKADQLALAGRLEDALALYVGVCKADPMDVEAWVKSSVTARRLGRLDEAERSARRAVLLSPDLAFAHHALGSALQSRGLLDEALPAYQRATALKPDYPDAHYLLGNALMAAGRLSEAETSLRRALALRPRFFEALSDLGALLLTTGQTDQAAMTLEQALALRPDSPEVLANLASLFEMDQRLDDALALYQRALCIRPGALDVQAKQADLLEKTGRVEAAREVLASGLARAPLHPLLNLVAARLERREQRFSDAAARLEAALAHPIPDRLRGEIHLLLGQLHDRLGNTAQVLAHLAEGKRRTAGAVDPEGARRRRYLEKVDHYRAMARHLSVRPEAVEPAADAASPIFLIGFPRSGTTLLESILDSHPGLRTLQEKPAAAAVEQAFLALGGGDSTALDRLTEAEVAHLRQVYQDEAARHVALPAGCRLVDKLPLNLVRVPLLWRIFPESRFILAVRHPCDVALSCLMQDFGANDAMAGFTSLESIADIYARVMESWREYCDRLPVHWQRIRYEDLVADFEPEARRLLDFLGMEWDDAVLDHTRHAQARGLINTPSYHQVTQPIYQHARYRWKRYEQDFAPVLATLQPYIEHFGYTAD